MVRDIENEIRDEKNPRPLDEDDIALLKTYGLGPYSALVKKIEKEIKELAKRINDLCGIKESDTGLVPPSQWDLVSDKQMSKMSSFCRLHLEVVRAERYFSTDSNKIDEPFNVEEAETVHVPPPPTEKVTL